MFDSSILERLRGIGLAAAHLQSLAVTPAHDDAALLRVVEVQRDALTLHDGNDEHPAQALPALLAELAAQADALAVGDWVLAARNPHGQWWVQQRLPPLTQLARRLHDGRDKVTRTVIVSNVDTALIVMGLDLDYNVRRLERYLAMVRLAGIGTVVVLTKADLCDDPAARAAEVAALLPPDAAVVTVNALQAGAADALAPWLTAGRTLVLLGASGTGKSTLTNTLVGDALQLTGGTRSGDGRGRHTTTARTLHRTPQGACIIDTPGLRTLRLDSEAGDVQAVFDDIAQLSASCRFRDCRHHDEPGCAVRGAVDDARLRNFHKLLRETQRDTMTALQRKAQLQVWKARSKASRERLREKQGR